jgi:phosphoribosylamine--glycine ligase
MAKTRVAVCLGSDSDWAIMEACVTQLRELGLGCDVEVMSAHRSPERVREFVRSARERGIEVIIAGAGMSAALAGALAAQTTLPVIGVPLAAGSLQGIDALLSTVQMPPGTPVGCVGIGSAGAQNAAILAAQIIALHDERLRSALDEHKAKLVEGVEAKNKSLQERLGGSG